MTDEFVKAWNAAIYRTVDFRGRPATVGRPDGTIFPVTESGEQLKHKMYATYTDVPAPNNVATVDRNGLPATPQMPILVQNIKGVPTAVLSLSGLLMGEYSNGGTSYPASAHNHYLEGPNPEYVEGRRFMPVGVHPSNPAALTVYIEPGFYRYFGTVKAWQGGDSGSLSAYVPVVADGRIHFVIIGLDRSDNTIDIIDGDDVMPGGDIYFPANAVVTYDDILAITIDPKYMPLAVVELLYGQTTINVKDITFDHRLWGGEVPNPLDIDALTEDTTPDVTADYLVTLDTSAGATKKVLAENMPGIKGNVGTIFNQRVDGVVANTTTPTDLLSTGIGSVTIPANTLEIGTTVRISMAGHLSTTGTPDFELSVVLDGLELASTGVNTLASGLTTVGWRLWFDFTCRVFPTFGAMAASGVWRLGASMYGLVNTSTTTVDPADPLQIEVLATWGTADAANTVTAQIATIEILSIVGL
jgi:hypothetical protein